MTTTPGIGGGTCPDGYGHPGGDPPRHHGPRGRGRDPQDLARPIAGAGDHTGARPHAERDRGLGKALADHGLRRHDLRQQLGPVEGGAIERKQTGARRDRDIGDGASRQTEGDQVSGPQDPSLALQALRVVGPDPGELGRDGSRIGHHPGEHLEVVPKSGGLVGGSPVPPDDRRSERLACCGHRDERLAIGRERYRLDLHPILPRELGAGFDGRRPPRLGILLCPAGSWLNHVQGRMSDPDQPVLGPQRRLRGARAEIDGQ